MEGKIKWYSQEKGYGFIEGNDGNDYFVHHTQVPQDLRLDEGVDVAFDPAETDRGSQARNVRAPGEAASEPAEAPADEPAAEEPASDEAAAEPVDEAAVEEAAEAEDANADEEKQE